MGIRNQYTIVEMNYRKALSRAAIRGDRDAVQKYGDTLRALYLNRIELGGSSSLTTAGLKDLEAVFDQLKIKFTQNLE